MKILFLLFGFLVITSTSNCQYRYATSFTTKDGLSCNWVYKCIEDKKGFLWIATEQGVVRFDGNLFQKFTTSNGLPDMDVYLMIMERDGAIWVVCHNNEIAYFDNIKNRFIKVNEKYGLKGFSKKIISYPYLHQDNGLYFPSIDTSLLFLNEGFQKYPMAISNKKSFIVNFQKDGSVIHLAWDTIPNSMLYLYHLKNNKVLDSCTIASKPQNPSEFVDDGKLYLFNGDSKKVITLSQFTVAPLNYKKDSIELTDKYYWHNFTKKNLILVQPNGNIEVLDKVSHKKIALLQCGTLPMGAYDDKSGNLWVSTKDKGILLYKINGISNYSISYLVQNKPWSCISRTKKGTILLGNSKGQIVEINERKTLVHKQRDSKNTDILRSIIISQGKVFSFGEGGLSVNYTRPHKAWGKACKSAYKLNDSIVIWSYTKGMYKLNTITESVVELNNGGFEVTCFAGFNSKHLYIGSIDGLHKYDYAENKIIHFQDTNKLIKERIVAMTTTSDNLLWVATASNGVIVQKDDKVIYHITEADGLLTNNITTIASGQDGQIWVGTNIGISIINYRSLKPSIQNISVKDGLTSNVINQFFFHHDTMYAATDNGVSVIPANISIPKFDIPIELTGVKINNMDTILVNYYDLKQDQNNIDVQFAGIELNGHFRNAQLSKDEGLTWADIGGHHTNLQFPSGEHHVWLRAIDVNGNIGTKILKLQFDIETPWFRRPWFLSLLAAVMFTVAIYLINRITRRKHQVQIEKLLNQQALDELEIQALKAQINPHFVFNCLNSIKGFIYDENFEQADLYLDKFSQLLRSTLDYSSQPSISLKSELTYIDTYLVLEKLRFGNKFDYSIDCDKAIQTNEIEIPAMILQPYVENAIKHGVCNLDDGLGKIRIKVYLVDEKLNIEIDDNGIGRKQSNKLKQNLTATHQSKGTQLTERRIELYHINSKVIDKQDENGKSLGTTIHLIIPIPL